MNTKKILIGTLVSGATMFFLGWLIYGIVLADFMSENCNSGNSRPMEEMVWWAMIASNFVWGFLLTLIIVWSGSTSIQSGAKIGAILGCLACLGFDLSMYSVTTMYSSFTVVAADVAGFTLMLAIAGLLTTLVMNKVGQQNA